MSSKILMIGAVLLAVACEQQGSSPASGSANPHLGTHATETCVLKLAPKQGEKFAYKVSMGAGPRAQVVISFSMLAEKVQGDLVTFLTTFEGMQNKGEELPAQALADIKKIRTRTVMDSTGRWISSSSEGLPPGQAEPNVSYGVSFPTGVVRVGDAWVGVSTNEGKQIPVRCRLIRIDRVDGITVAVIEACPSGDLGLSLALNGPITIAVELSTGMMLTTSMKAKSTEDGRDGTPLWVEVKRT